jgi:hypothetical protein
MIAFRTLGRRCAALLIRTPGRDLLDQLSGERILRPLLTLVLGAGHMWRVSEIVTEVGGLIALLTLHTIQCNHATRKDVLLWIVLLDVKTGGVWAGTMILAQFEREKALVLLKDLRLNILLNVLHRSDIPAEDHSS